MTELKPISPEAIPQALEKVERYRLLNEPGEAESICRAEELRPRGNDEAILRWNACARLMRDRDLGPRPADLIEQPIE